MERKDFDQSDKRYGGKNAGTGFRILVVEDDECLKTALFKAIHAIAPESDIRWATTARQAFEELRSSGIDLVISDYVLPESSTGLWIWERFRKHNPTTPFLLMSGIPVEHFLQLTNGRKLCPRFLPKPFRPDEFREAVGDMIEEARLARVAVKKVG